MKNNRKTYLIPTITIVEVRHQTALMSGGSNDKAAMAERSGYSKATVENWDE